MNHPSATEQRLDRVMLYLRSAQSLNMGPAARMDVNDAIFHLENAIKDLRSAGREESVSAAYEEPDFEWWRMQGIHACIERMKAMSREIHDLRLSAGRDADLPTDRELALQAKIDALMLEYCPDEMTKEQIEEWMLAQVAAPEHRISPQAGNNKESSYPQSMTTGHRVPTLPCEFCAAEVSVAMLPVHDCDQQRRSPPASAGGIEFGDCAQYTPTGWTVERTIANDRKIIGNLVREIESLRSPLTNNAAPQAEAPDTVQTPAQGERSGPVGAAPVASSNDALARELREWSQQHLAMTAIEIIEEAQGLMNKAADALRPTSASWIDDDALTSMAFEMCIPLDGLSFNKKLDGSADLTGPWRLGLEQATMLLKRALAKAPHRVSATASIEVTQAMVDAVNAIHGNCGWTADDLKEILSVIRATDSTASATAEVCEKCSRRPMDADATCAADDCPLGLPSRADSTASATADSEEIAKLKIKYKTWMRIADQRAIEVADLRVSNENLRSNFERECQDGDKIAAALGVQRTEGGSLMVARSVNRINALEANIHALEDAITSELPSGMAELVLEKRASMLKPEELISTK